MGVSELYRIFKPGRFYSQIYVTIPPGHGQAAVKSALQVQLGVSPFEKLKTKAPREPPYFEGGRDSSGKLPFCHSLLLIELPLAEGGY